jgi:Flp pilus assembly protein TadD
VAYGWLKNGFKKEALAAMAAMPTHSAKSAEWLAKAGVRFMEAGLFKEAEGFMDRALATSPKDWEICLDFGRAAAGQKEMETAGRWFMCAVQLRPRDEEVWMAIATAYSDAGRH